MAKKKFPRNRVPAQAATSGKPSQEPRVEEQVDFMRCRPLWSFAVLDLLGKFGWGHLAKVGLEELLARLRSFETMTWKEILVDGRKQNHAIKVEICCSEAQKRLQALGLDDVDELVSLRINSTARIIGILDRSIFKILWWDPDHEVCPSALRHT